MARDLLILITPGFPDTKLSPDRLYYCPQCNIVEGLLATFPELTEKVDVMRVPFARPRPAVIERIGEENQGLPVLIFADPATAPADALAHGETCFVSNIDRLCELLAERYGIPYSH
ncbi:DUF3088 domain-containing protein [Rhizobium sp. C1]|uniref:DUF3088 domain-containing protein n=1 Tax=Rhizobium sp. C1 TaxID=1349799 RepID=UPI001E4DD3F8|nr:DUF3088 domain-containing protein [Rhizobium sp. C1]MCD2178850.1 DUF3088 domain-containing protein [Rhizobium sp. C1]